VILQLTQAAAIVFVRSGHDWLSEIVVGDNAISHLSEVGIDVLLDEIYANVVLRDDLTENSPG
jgi:hypothetical protein